MQESSPDTNRTFKNDVELRDWYERQIKIGNVYPHRQNEVLKNIRKQILLQPLPQETIEEKRSNSSCCTLRGRLWKILLHVGDLSGSEYTGLVRRGKSQVHDKIKNDVFRTFRNDIEFRERVHDDQLTRGLNALAHKMMEGKNGGRISYVQGMNVLLGPFLYVMPEVDSFYCFHRLLDEHIPHYVDMNCSGVHLGLELFSECLFHCDRQLHEKLKAIPVESYAFSPTMSLLAGSPPLSEVLKLWDFLFAFGAHLNIICVLAQVIGLRNFILAEKSPANLLRKLPPLESEQIISTATIMARKLPTELYEKVTTHARTISANSKYTSLHTRIPTNDKTQINTQLNNTLPNVNTTAQQQSNRNITPTHITRTVPSVYTVNTHATPPSEKASYLSNLELSYPQANEFDKYNTYSPHLADYFASPRPVGVISNGTV
eukprot:CFRG0305T1